MRKEGVGMSIVDMVHKTLKPLKISKHTFIIIISMISNFLSSVGVVLVNKWIFDIHGFRFGTFITFLHFLTTAVSLRVLGSVGFFPVKEVNVFTPLIMISGAFCGFVLLTNMSLKLNSVGFYQVSKIMTTPTIVVIQSIFYGEQFPADVKGSLVPVVIGAVLATTTDFAFNWNGTIVAALGVLAASMYQIWAGSKQRELECDSLQLLYHQAPISALMMLCLIPLTEDVYSEKGLIAALQMNLTFPLMREIFISCLLAVVVNVSTYAVIGNTSPITYNVMGHGKTCVIIIAGFILFSYPVMFKNVLGIVLCLSGIFLYTYFKIKERG